MDKIKIAIGAIYFIAFVLIFFIIIKILKWLSIAELLTIIISSALVIITYFYYDTTRKTMWHRVLLEIKRDYRSPEMAYAMHTLWNFYRDECNEDEKILRKKYLRIFKKELKKISSIKDPIEKIGFKKITLDSQRRLVSEYFYHLSDLIRNGIIPEKILFGSIHPADMEIIPYIIDPMNDALVNYITKERLQGISKVYKDKISRLSEFYKAYTEY